MSIKSEVRHAKRQVIEQLVALRDEGKLQLHLLNLDARKRWNELEQEVDLLEARAAREGEKAGESLTETAHELLRIVRDFTTAETNHSSGLLTNVRSLMSSHLRTCRVDDTLNHAAHLMWDGDWGAIPVLSDDVAVGMLTDRDICMATYTQGKSPAELRVESAMSKDLFSCRPDDSVGAALELMGERRVRRLTVVDGAGKLVGMLSVADVARWARAIKNATVDAALAETLGLVSALAPEKLQAVAAE